MSTNSYIPENPGNVEWDVVVIGTGMGGATTGYGLAKLGRRVLFIEKGLFFHGNYRAQEDGSAKSGEVLSSKLAVNTDERPEIRLKNGLWPLRIKGKTSFGEIEFFAPLGCGSGGSTSLYAAGLERFTPADFLPKSNFPEVHDSTLPEKWPITYEELQPFYTQAEELFRVRGTQDPLRQNNSVVLREPPPLSPRDQHLFDSFSQLGLHPYRVHVGFEFVDGCEECLAGLCPRGCKNDSGRICLLPALQKYGASILPECEVLKLESGKSEVQNILCRTNGEEISIRAKMIVLAAGAFMTPVLLLKSKSEDWPEGLANRSGLVGRNLMFHVADFFVVRPTKNLSSIGPKKSLAFNDFYFSDGEKLGICQAVGAGMTVGQIMGYMREIAEREPTWWKKLASPNPVWWRKLSSPVIRLIALVVYYFFNFKSAAIWGSVIEDLPYFDNCVVLDPQARNGWRFEYRYTEELKTRVQSYRARLARVFGSHRIFVVPSENNTNYGHVCGTCRFGDNPETSVLDKNNRAHDLSNLYVVDASFFPSSGGANPSLTIAANALRVAEAIHKQLG